MSSESSVSSTAFLSNLYISSNDEMVEIDLQNDMVASVSKIWFIFLFSWIENIFSLHINRKIVFYIWNSILQIVPEDGTTTQQPQPTKLESFFALTKSLIIRALIIYFVSSFLRKPSSTPDVNTNQSGVPSSMRPSLAASNLFQNGTLFDLHVYLSEEQSSVNFSDTKSLLWFQEGLLYGDWYSGSYPRFLFDAHLIFSKFCEVCSYINELFFFLWFW